MHPKPAALNPTKELLLTVGAVALLCGILFMAACLIAYPDKSLAVMRRWGPLCTVLSSFCGLGAAYLAGRKKQRTEPPKKNDAPASTSPTP